MDSSVAGTKLAPEGGVACTAVDVTAPMLPPGGVITEVHFVLPDPAGGDGDVGDHALVRQRGREHLRGRDGSAAAGRPARQRGR